MAFLPLVHLTPAQLDKMFDQRFTELTNDMAKKTGNFAEGPADPYTLTDWSISLANGRRLHIVKNGEPVKLSDEDQAIANLAAQAIEEADKQPLGRLSLSSTFLATSEDLGRSNDKDKINHTLWIRNLIQRPTFIALRKVADKHGWLLSYSNATHLPSGEKSFRVYIDLTFVRDSLDFKAEFITFNGFDSDWLFLPKLREMQEIQAKKTA